MNNEPEREWRCCLNLTASCFVAHLNTAVKTTSAEVSHDYCPSVRADFGRRNSGSTAVPSTMRIFLATKMFLSATSLYCHSMSGGGQLLIRTLRKNFSVCPIGPIRLLGLVSYRSLTNQILIFGILDLNFLSEFQQ